MLRNLIVLLMPLIFLTGCAVKNSYPVEYQRKPITGIEVNNTSSIGVTQWSDKRNVASVKDELAEKAVMRMGPATVGITSNGQKFVRVADFVRDNFIAELKSLGVNAKALTVVPSSSDAKLLKNIAKNNDVDMVLAGDLLAFDVNCHGAWTLECSRNVSFSLSLVDQLGEQLITRELFDATMANNEGMGVLHKTLLKQLTNEVMREALEKAIIKTISELNNRS